MTAADLRPDDLVVARLSRAVSSLDPDPLFRRRLRGEVLNRHVAVREGLARAERPRQMGRLGRSVLIASVALAASVGSVGAVSQQALPGDPLYAVKRQIEEIRLQAAPAWMHAGLELAALDERLEEVERLAASHRWSDLQLAVDQAVAIRGQLPAADAPLAEAALAKHAAVLQRLLTEVPDSGRKGIERALEASRGHGRPAIEPRAPATPSTPAAPASAAPSAPDRPKNHGSAPANAWPATNGSPPADHATR